MRKVDLSAYSAKASRLKPEKVSLGDLPPIQKPPKQNSQETQSHKGANAQKQEVAKSHLQESTKVQSHKPTNVHDYRPIVRKTVDLYLDQIEMIDTWRARMRRERGGGSVTQGEAVREIFDFFKKEKNL